MTEPAQPWILGKITQGLPVGPAGWAGEADSEGGSFGLGNQSTSPHPPLLIKTDGKPTTLARNKATQNECGKGWWPPISVMRSISLPLSGE